MRTEDQKATKAPIQMKFGSKDYEVKPLNILKGQAWRSKLNDVMGPISDQFKGNGTSVQGVLKSALMEFPDKVLELIFAYGPELPKDQIMEEASDEQVATAFSEVMTVAYPYLAPLTMVTKILRPSSSQQ